MHILHRVAPWALLVAAGIGHADGGLKVGSPGGYWSDLQTRLRFSAAVLEPLPPQAALSVGRGEAGHYGLGAAASLTGDYYFYSRELIDPRLPPSGFRASGAVFVRPGGVPLSDLVWSSRASSGLAPSWRPAYGMAVDAGSLATSATPYLGIGYSDYSLKAGWSFWADIGLAVENPGQALGMGRVLTGSQGIDDLVRELRLAPMMQLGVNYAF
jgi:hypothetical protein